MNLFGTGTIYYMHIFLALVLLIIISPIFIWYIDPTLLSRLPLIREKDINLIFNSIPPISISISAFIAILLYSFHLNKAKQEREINKSERFLKESIDLLQRIYSVFTNNGENASPPDNDRLLWLTTARMIVRYYNVKKNVSASEHIDVLEEHEEYWRFIFYKVLDDNKANFTRTYFEDDPDNRNGPIHRASIAIIFDFAKWKEGKPDPLVEFDAIDAFARGVVPIDQIGLLEFMEDQNNYWEEVLRVREEKYPIPHHVYDD